MLNANLSKCGSFGIGKVVLRVAGGENGDGGRHLGRHLVYLLPGGVRNSSSSSKLSSSYKVISKRSADALDELTVGPGRGGHLASVNSNWQLLDPNGYSFFLPGSIGLAWTEPNHIDSLNQFLGIDSYNLECSVQDCPILLRQCVLDIFPGAKLSNGSISVMTITHNLAKNKNKKMSEQEWENMTKLFVMVAQNICLKLKMANYWADFINPFSGLPYLNAFYNPRMQDADRTWLTSSGFTVLEHNHCRVIKHARDHANTSTSSAGTNTNNSNSSNASRSNVLGIIYTSSPTNSAVVQDVASTQSMCTSNFET